MIVIPMLLVGGYFSNESNYVPYLIPFKMISPIKWTLELLNLNQVDSPYFNCMNAPTNCVTYIYDESTATGYAVLSALGVFFIILSYLILYFCIKIKV